jgi:serine/threonine protein phosphatase 1
MIYVLSDIHGNEGRFDSILEQIDLQPEDTLYILGDVIDRHPGGIRILRRIMAADNMKMLLGNHEHMMLEALGYTYGLDDPVSTPREVALMRWYRNGGKVTHDYLKRIRKSLREEIVEYLLALPLNIHIQVNETCYTLVHGASPEEYDPSGRYVSPVQFAVWNRWQYADFPHRKSTLIFGHTPTIHYQSDIPMKIKHGENCIAIDCGSGYPQWSESERKGRLACIRLDDGKEFYSGEVIS